MGGVPVLLMIAAMGMGITYGWQPDENGDGVQYIVQVPTSELDQLETIGEITSVIDPSVRGQVSKIVIRVGDAPLPRRMPSQEIASSDAAPIAAPEITTLAQTRAMKPQSGQPGNQSNSSGFAFPTTPNLADAAQNLRNNIDQAGREIAARADQGLNSVFGPPAAAGSISGSTAGNPSTVDTRGSALVPPPSTRPRLANASAIDAAARSNESAVNNSSFAAPPLLGPADPATGNPASAWGNAPPRSGERDNSWVDPNRSSFDASAPSATGSNGLRNSDTFGRTPAGLGLSNDSTNMTSSSTQNNQASNGQTANIGRTPAVSQYEQIMADRRAQELRDLREQELRDERAAIQQRQTSLAQGQATQTPPTRLQPPVTQRDYRAEAQAARTPNYRAATSTTPDSRLTAAQIRAGAWAVDDQDRIYNTQGEWMRNEYLQNEAPSFTSPSDRVLDNQYLASQYPSGTQSTNGPLGGYPLESWNRGLNAGSDAVDRREPVSMRPGINESQAAQTNAPARDDRGSTSGNDRAPSRTGSDANLDFGDRNGSGNGSSTLMDPPQVAAQPLFNGLLLISFVANVYLVFWLKNLRLQFRDMVAGKRQSSSAGAVV